MSKKEKLALTDVSIDRQDWKVNVGHNTSFKCDLPFEVCKRLAELYESGDEDDFEALKQEYDGIFDDECDCFDDFENIFYNHMVGEETNEYSEYSEEITEEEYDQIVEGGLNHECGGMCINDLNSDEFVAFELYAG